MDIIEKKIIEEGEEKMMLRYINGLSKIDFERLCGKASLHKGGGSILKRMYDIIEQERDKRVNRYYEFICDFAISSEVKEEVDIKRLEYLSALTSEAYEGLFKFAKPFSCSTDPQVVHRVMLDIIGKVYEI